MAPPLGIAPSSHRLTGGPHTLCVERNCSRQMQSWPRQRN
jgi:hypothetical protein